MRIINFVKLVLELSCGLYCIVCTGMYKTLLSLTKLTHICIFHFSCRTMLLRLHSRVAQLTPPAVQAVSSLSGRASPGYSLPTSLQQCRHRSTPGVPNPQPIVAPPHEFKPIKKLLVANRGNNARLIN